MALAHKLWALGLGVAAILVLSAAAPAKYGDLEISGAWARPTVGSSTEGVVYVSQADRLCGLEGCRRLVGPKLPEDMLAVDYGHYSVNGSIFAVKTMLGPVIEAMIGKRQVPTDSSVP